MAKMDNLNQLQKPPEDIQQGWLDLCRRMQAALCKNNGMALATITVAAVGTNAVAWAPPKIELIEPIALSEKLELTDEAYQVLFALLHSKDNDS